jgi:uncharacterized protein YndB with AHSA1/START domain
MLSKTRKISALSFEVGNKYLYCSKANKPINQPMDDKLKYEMEFPIKASPSLLYQYISTPSGMSEWYADNVNSRGEFFTFIWEGSEEVAKLLTKKNGERIKFRWEEDEDTDYYFELRIQVDEITKDVSLMVTDFADEDEIDEGKMLWENMVSNLKHILGST